MRAPRRHSAGGVRPWLRQGWQRLRRPRRSAGRTWTPGVRRSRACARCWAGGVARRSQTAARSRARCTAPTSRATSYSPTPSRRARRLKVRTRDARAIMAASPRNPEPLRVGVSLARACAGCRAHACAHACWHACGGGWVSAHLVRVADARTHASHRLKRGGNDADAHARHGAHSRQTSRGLRGGGDRRGAPGVDVAR